MERGCGVWCREETAAKEGLFGMMGPLSVKRVFGMRVNLHEGSKGVEGVLHPREGVV